MSHIAKGRFEVSLKPLPLDWEAGAMKLGRMSIDKQIFGDLLASTHGEMLSVITETKGSAGYVAIEHVTGSLLGRSGSFVFQHSATMDRGAPALSITVVPDSATGELVGLQGSFKIDIRDGQHYYEFDYSLPDVES
jgi:hypothetical protein